MSSTVRSSGDWTDSDEDTAAESDVEIQLLEKTDAASKFPSRVSRPTLKLLHTIRCGRRLQWHSIGRTIFSAITPSFIRRQYAEQTNETKSNNGIPALDGLRGLACIFVINEHLTYNLTTTFLHGYGDEYLRSIIQWPFIRVFWSGFSMVAIFYVISGYVLSYKPLKQIRSRDMTSFQRTVTSSIFRRTARLYLPTIIAVLLCGIFTYLGAFRYSSYLFGKDDNYLNLHEPLPRTFDSLGGQMLDATKAALRMLNVWDWTDDLSAGDYDLHTWTIVVELRSSMVLFLLLIGTSHLQQTFRLLTTSAFLLFCIITARKDVLLFTSGMLLADIDLSRTSHPTLLPSTTTQTSQHTRLTTRHAQHIWLLLFILGLYLASVPVFGVYSTPGYITLSTTFTPPGWDAGAWLRCLGAILITWSSVNSRWLQPIFTNRVSQYLGKTSFALYLVHGNVVKSLGYSVLPWVYGVVHGGTANEGREGVSVGGMVSAWVLSVLLVMPVVVWLADLFWRVVDLRCVRVARWIEVKMSMGIESGEKDKCEVVRSTGDRCEMREMRTSPD